MEELKKVVKYYTDFWGDHDDVFFIIYDRVFFKSFKSYEEFKSLILDDDFLMEHLHNPGIAIIEGQNVIGNWRIKSKYKTLKEGA